MRPDEIGNNELKIEKTLLSPIIRKARSCHAVNPPWPGVRYPSDRSRLGERKECDVGNVVYNASDDAAILGSILKAMKGGDASQPSRQTPGPGHQWEGSVQDKALWHLPGFGRKTRIRTTFGDLPIEVLRVGDQLAVADGGIARVAWVDKIALDADYLQRNASALPILIRENAADYGKPLRDLLVSPQQELAFGLANFRPRFRTAGTISGRAQIGRAQVQTITYYLFHCQKPVVAYAEGVPVRIAPLPEGTMIRIDE